MVMTESFLESQGPGPVLRESSLEALSSGRGTLGAGAGLAEFREAKPTMAPCLPGAAMSFVRSGLGVTLGGQVNQKAGGDDTEVMF